MKKAMLMLLMAMAALSSGAIDTFTSVAGFFPIENQGRQVWNFNPEWRFHLGDVVGAEKTDFDDRGWEVVATPHCVKLEPAEASGCRNYQGIAWYRKHFTVPADHSQLYFEAIMGKQKIYVNGRLAKEHFGGYLPVTVDIGAFGLKKGDACVVAVMTDNSDDKSYPPGKTQMTLDFSYHGGIYRDVWLIAKQHVYITDVIEANRQAGGGVFIHYDQISAERAGVAVKTQLRNRLDVAQTVTVEQTFMRADGKIVGRTSRRVRIEGRAAIDDEQHVVIRNPRLWSPETPYLYSVVTRVKQGSRVLDGGRTRFGIRDFAFRGREGFWLNGKRYRQLVGANRHQDFAYVGNAVPNSQQWRDVMRLKLAGFNIIRTAHYPQDPAFMDACDELGIFVIVATPGWQFWNAKDPAFEARVMQNTKEIIRIERNHPSVLMWEPILNETRYPESFSLNSLQVTRDEYPYPYRPVAAADVGSAGVRDHYDVVYGWPGDDEKADRPAQCIFTREFGEYVDDWYAHNNLNRASRSWGEHPQLVQALSLASTTEEMYRTKGQFIGGCQWHPFDHQRGYHPDPYWGGIYDAFRQPKTAFYFFSSQRQVTAPDVAEPLRVDPMVYVAHEMTPFSDSDVVVFSNCDSVRLSIYDGAKSWTLPVNHTPKFLKDDPDLAGINRQYAQSVVFKNVWNFWEARDYSYPKKAWQKVNMVAEGISDGRVVCSVKRMPSRRSTKLRLRIDSLGKPLVADGSDFIVVVAEVTDDNGNVRRLAKESVRFTVEGEGEIIGDETINANPRLVEWGSAPILIRSTRTAGLIRVRAEVQFPGTHAPTPAELTFSSVPYRGEYCFEQQERPTTGKNRENLKPKTAVGRTLSDAEKDKLLKEVEQQQTDFGIMK